MQFLLLYNNNFCKTFQPKFTCENETSAQLRYYLTEVNINVSYTQEENRAFMANRGRLVCFKLVLTAGSFREAWKSIKTDSCLLCFNRISCTFVLSVDACTYTWTEGGCGRTQVKALNTADDKYQRMSDTGLTSVTCFHAFSLPEPASLLRELQHLQQLWSEVCLILKL